MNPIASPGAERLKTFNAVGLVVVRILIGGTLLTAGFLKALGPAAEFAAAIDAYQILPTSWTPPLALVMPWVEIYVGLALLTGYLTRWAALGAAGLFLTFIGALGSALIRGIDLSSCGCLGTLVPLSPSRTLLMDVALGVGALLLAWRPSSRFSLDYWIDRP